MTDFVTDGQPYETPISAADQGYALTPPSLSSRFAAMFGESSPLSRLMSVSQQGAYEGSSTLSRALYQTATTDEYGQPLDPSAPEAGSIKSPMLDPDVYNEKYAPTGPDGKKVSLGDKPMPEGVAQIIAKAKAQEIEREGVLSRASQTESGVVNFGIGTGAFLADPLNLSTMFIPGIGEESIAARLGTGILARTGARLAAGAATGALMQAPVTALNYGLGQQEASDYGIREAFRDMLFAAAGNAVFHAGMGTVGDVLRARQGTPVPLGEATAQPVTPAAEQVLMADAATRHDAMSAAVSQLADGRPVDVSPFFYESPRPETAIGLAPTEDILRPQITGVAESTSEQARRLAPAVFNEYDPLAQRAAEISNSLRDPEQSFGVEIDQRILDLRQQADAIAARPLPIDATAEQIKAAQAADTEAWNALRAEADRMTAQRGALIDQATAAARAEFQALDERMRDLAPQVSAATEQARLIQSAAAANRATVLGPRPNLIKFAQDQQALYRQGFAAGIPDSEFQATSKAMFEPEQAAPEEGAAPKVIPSQGAAGEIGKAPEAVAIKGNEEGAAEGKATEVDPEIASAEAALTPEHLAAMLPEERAELDATQANMEEAEGHAASIEEAGMCLKGSA